MHEIYEPREDSELILSQIKNYSVGTVLDMGTGSGVLAEEAAKYAEKVIAVDINSQAIAYCKKRIKKKNIEFRQSDLFTKVREKFDLIIFNPPYLPNDPKVKSLALDGGEMGHELIERFLKEAKKHLNKTGKILLLFSSVTHKNKILEIIKEEHYTTKIIKTEKLFYEELYLAEITISINTTNT